MQRRPAADTAWLVVDTTIGVAVEGARASWWIGGTVARTLRPLTDLAARPPLVPDRYRPAQLLGGLALEGHRQRGAATRAVRHLLQRSVPVAAAEILDQLDLTELIRERVDLIGLARYVAAGIHPSGSIREVTGPVSSAAGQGTRIQEAEAEEAVAEWVDRVFGPRHPAADDEPDEPTESDEPTEPG